jgi:hypothetical protein
MELRNRVLKLEQGNNSSGFVIVVVNECETNEQAYQRCFPDGRAKPKVVVYATPLDEMI